MVILQLCCWTFSHKETLSLTLFDRNWILFNKTNKKSIFEPPFGGLRGNVRTPSIPRWKVRGRLYIHHNWTFLLSLMVETLYAEIWRSRRFSKGWVTLSANFRRKEASPSNHCWCQKTTVQWFPFRVVSKYPQCTVWFLSQCTRVTDRPTDRQNYDSKNCTNMAVRAVKQYKATSVQDDCPCIKTAQIWTFANLALLL